MPESMRIFFFFFNDTATTEIYTLPYTTLFRSQGAISRGNRRAGIFWGYFLGLLNLSGKGAGHQDRKSTRLNSSHSQISYAVFCLKKKKIIASGSTPTMRPVIESRFSISCEVEK